MDPEELVSRSRYTGSDPEEMKLRRRAVVGAAGLMAVVSRVVVLEVRVQPSSPRKTERSPGEVVPVELWISTE